MKEPLRELLKELGFTEKEVVVYLAVLKRRRVAPAELSQSTHLNRTTVYAVANSLISKGLLAEDLAGKKRTLFAVPPGELQKLLRKEEREFKEREKTIAALMRELALAQVGAEYPVPKVRFVEDADIESFLYDSLKKWNESAKKYDGVWWGFQDHAFVGYYKAWLDWLWKNTPPGIEVKLLSNQSDIEKRLAGKYPKRSIKFWDKAGQFTATTWVVGDFLVLLQTAAKPFYLIEIHDALLAHNQREVFKNIWKLV